MNERQNESSFASEQTRIYRLNWAYRAYHLAAGAAALVGAVMAYHFLILSIALALFSVLMISRPLVMRVAVDQSSVTLRGMFSANSLQRSSITVVETKHTGKGDLLILWGNLDKREKLEIPNLFAFDEDWENWWGSYRDLSDDRPISLF